MQPSMMLKNETRASSWMNQNNFLFLIGIAVNQPQKHTD